MKQFSILVLLVFSVSAFANAATVVQITMDGKCAKFDVETGAFVDYIGDHHCGSNKKVWSSTGHCVEVNFAGKEVKTCLDYECGEDLYQRVLVREGKPLSVLTDKQYFVFLGKDHWFSKMLAYGEILPALALGIASAPDFRKDDEVRCYRTSGGNRPKNPVHDSYCQG